MGNAVNIGKGSGRRWAVGLAVLMVGLAGRIEIVTTAKAVQEYQPPPDADWTANATLEDAHAITDLSIGATQGVAVRDGKIYGYGDVVFEEPRIGRIKEYTIDLEPTGRAVDLTRNGEPLITHPTGLTWHPEFGTFLGDTVEGVATIHRLDWERAWKDRNLDNAVLDVITDDAAINGCRPTFVTVNGRDFLATADYGDVRPEIRLMDPKALLEAGRTSAPGVIVHRIPCGPFNQNLYWDASEGPLVCVQNVVAGRGWRLDVIDLERAVADGRANGPGARLETLTFMPHDELEGWWPIDDERAVFAIARRKHNLLIGTVKRIEPTPSPKGSTLDGPPAEAEPTAP